MDVSYTHRLDPRTDANLTAAILAVGNLLGVSPVADNVIEHLKDRIGDSLSRAQRADPNSVYSGDLLGRVAEYVKETYGIDRPANIHAAPQGPQGRDLPIASDSMFALDGLGRNRFEQLTSGTSGSYARALSAVSSSSAAYGTLSAPWNSASGAAGLNEFNFGATDFAQRGLDLPTTRFLFGQGFTMPQILNSATDLQAVGLDPKNRELAEGAATQERFDPEGRGQRQSADRGYDTWAKDNAGEINRRLTAIESMQPGTPEYEAAVADLNQLTHQGYVETGQAAADERLRTVAAAPGAKAGDREQAVEAQHEKRDGLLKKNGVNTELLHEVGASSDNSVSTEAIVDAQVTAGLAQENTRQQNAAAADDFGPSDEAPPQDKQVSAKPVAKSAEPAEEPAKPVAPIVKPPPQSGPSGVGHR